MADREDDDRRRPRPVPGWGSWGQSVDPSAAGSVGGSGGGKAFGDPGVGHAAGQSTGGAGGVGGVGGDKGIGDFGGVKSFGDTGLGHAAGQPLGNVADGKAFGHTGFGPPGHSGMAHTGGGVSAKTVLVAGAATVAVGATAVAALLALRPDAPRQNAEQAEQRGAEVGANPAGGGTPGGGGAGEALFRGTYRTHVTVTSASRTTVGDHVGVATTDCAECDVTLVVEGNSNTFHWNGRVLEMQTTGPICPGDTVTLTPTAEADGFIQGLDYYFLTCNGTLSEGTLTRIGD